ncbi:transglycosylase domain-containing protein [Terricaulis silvestris]|uniref:Penicillin-binding protein 4 n=1 Tax=Terricaulis silvestris TaxID=2686094 RepID=A0A6I6MPT7_9CAUL|nr:PBP1A family penicillin-binding protein [Terricaulis silvestris]QGZ95386.1 Penicillin-binding protein 4 precursor [Terricaulis silvestris]
MADENDPTEPEDLPPTEPPAEGGESSVPEERTVADAEPDLPADEHQLFEETTAADTPEPVEASPEREPELASQPYSEPEFFTAAPEEPAPVEETESYPEREAVAEPSEEPAPVGEAGPYEEPAIAARDEEPEAIAEPDAPIAASPVAEPTDLPPHYFRAAGDPDEGEAEAPPSQWGRIKARIEETRRDIWAAIEPGWVKFWGVTNTIGAEIWRRIRGVKRPRNIREAAVWSGYAAGGFVALIIGFFFFVTWGMPSTDDLWEARQGQSITFLDRNGNVILREGAQNAPPVDIASLPPYVAQAFIAIEDRRFYDHFGVDFGGMMRAGAENFRAGRVVQGGSTITQQLAKNLFLTNERSWRRKFQEIAMAIWLETRFTKDEILALYLSRVYFGAGAYGVEAAAERYFDRPARELTLLQSAMIAGLVKAPSRLNPARQDIAAARDRATTVLNEMVSMGFISASESEAALQEELVISRRNPAGVLSYYRDWIDPLLNDVIGQQRDDFIIETTIDIAAQRSAAESIETVLAEQGEERRVSQSAALVMDDTGGVRAMVGGRDYDVSQFNRATQARRQPGSSFKFFIYLAAMENGLTPWSVREDAPITISIEGQPDWTPGNYTNEFNGPVSLNSAFANSFNMVAIRVANEVGGQKVIDVARRLGVRSPLHNYHSLALGAQEMTLLEMTQAYGAMAADGFNVEAHGVTRIRRANSNETMWSWRQENRSRVIEERPMRYMNMMMSRVVQAGTGTRARMTTHQIGGKTGTGNDYRDAWFIGFTPGMVGGVWVGNDNFTETARVTGGSLPADIWARFMPVALRNTPSRPLEMPGEGDYDLGIAAVEMPELTAVGAPIGATIGAEAAPAPPDDQDRSLDFGPEG